MQSLGIREGLRHDFVDRVGVFISIPKNASKAVLKILDLGENRNKENTNSLIIFENHQRGEVLNRKYDLDNLFVFCFSRNPYDRCISWFEYHQDIEPYKSLTFEQWVKAGMPHHVIRQNETDYVNEGISPLLQYNYVKNCKIDLVGKMENFSDDLTAIVERLNCLCKDKNINHTFSNTNARLNTSKRAPNIAQYYSPETKAIVYETLRKDFDYFKYEK